MSEKGESSRPMSVMEHPWLVQDSAEIRLQYPMAMEETGKWMIFYDNQNIDDAWEKAKQLYENRELDGIINLKVATAFDNPRANSRDSKVIIFYCGPSGDEGKVMAYGRNLLEKMSYKRQKSAGYFPPYIYYKTDVLTLGGTAATGQKKNYLYKLRY
jgi:hypothetical protein